MHFHDWISSFYVCEIEYLDDNSMTFDVVIKKLIDWCIYDLTFHIYYRAAF